MAALLYLIDTLLSLVQLCFLLTCGVMLPRRVAPDPARQQWLALEQKWRQC